MRRRWWTLVLGLCFAMSIAAPSPSRSAGADSSATMAVTLGPGSRLWLEGTSTLHEYESETHELTLLFVRDPAAAPVSDANGLEASIRSSGFRSVDVRVPVLTLRSKKSGLDKNLWKALKAESHPAIRCQLSHYTALSQAQGQDTLRIRADGTLEVAGRSRPITLDAKAWKSPAGLWISGSQPLLMSDYGIKPPTMMMGTLRVADRVTVFYRLLLTPKSGNAGSSPR